MAITTDQILDLIASEASVDRAILKDTATFEELNIGSLDVACVLFALEDQFSVIIEPDDISPTATVSDFVNLVLSRIS